MSPFYFRACLMTAIFALFIGAYRGIWYPLKSQGNFEVDTTFLTERLAQRNLSRATLYNMK